MLCIPELTLNSDRPYWVTRDSFYSYFDQEDFLNRTKLSVAHAYLSDWFHKTEAGDLHFYIPTVGVVAGKTQFINGRHRAAVLLYYLDEIPIAFAVEHIDEKARQIMEYVQRRPLTITIPIDIPDLPIFDKLG
jgi:hypothetical protein